MLQGEIGSLGHNSWVGALSWRTYGQTASLISGCMVICCVCTPQGQLGLGSTDSTCRPNMVLGALEGRRVVQVGHHASPCV